MENSSEQQANIHCTNATNRNIQFHFKEEKGKKVRKRLAEKVHEAVTGCPSICDEWIRSSPKTKSASSIKKVRAKSAGNIPFHLGSSERWRAGWVENLWNGSISFGFRNRKWNASRISNIWRNQRYERRKIHCDAPQKIVREDFPLLIPVLIYPNHAGIPIQSIQSQKIHSIFSQYYVNLLFVNVIDVN